ncbi:sporulation protein YabP [Chakrabartyella piscis]|uniref:sporulation protein YabP n=1 Tax=Chakrabartyella piscis TaxID=2918914 RepID=UPI002958A126|nr:sporulation protein YabP [Chakrabartyella piscis]
MAENKTNHHHFVRMENREELQIGGVQEVISFDEEGVMMETICGLLLVKGLGLHMGKLDLSVGEVTVEGTIDTLTYTEGGASGSFFSKLFR